MTPVIRAATEDDADDVRRVGELTWPPTYAFAGDDYVAHGLSTWWSDEATTRTLRDTTVLVAVVDDEIVGMGNIGATWPAGREMRSSEWLRPTR